MSYSPEYEAWAQMIQRCYNPKNHAYSSYGGRGISVCEHWKSSFAGFLKDMGKRPSSKHSLDRIDNSKGYSAENCRWATQKQQTRNTRRNRFLTLGEKTMTVAAWAEAVGISSRLIRERLDRGCSVADALTNPTRQ